MSLERTFAHKKQQRYNPIFFGLGSGRAWPKSRHTSGHEHDHLLRHKNTHIHLAIHMSNHRDKVLATH